MSNNVHKEMRAKSLLKACKNPEILNISVLPPVLSREQFAAYTGTTNDTVRGWIQTNTIPTIKMGRQRLVNIAKLVKDLQNGKTNFRQGDYKEN